jgi:hypothetical protein
MVLFNSRTKRTLRKNEKLQTAEPVNAKARAVALFVAAVTDAHGAAERW